MKGILYILMAIVCFWSSSCTDRATTEQIKTISNITEHNDQDALTSLTFGSCNKVDLKQPLWDDIYNEHSNIWMWLGDIIYADTENMDDLRNMFNEQNQIAGYQKIKSESRVLGIWDDHDYGVNDGDKFYPKKKESRDILFDFLEISKQNAARKHEGAYQSYVLGLPPNKTKIILLDTRYFKDPIRREKGVYLADKEADILGTEQWAWLENELKEQADLYIIANGTQVLPKEHRFEKWANFPNSRKTLLDHLSKLKSKVVLLSGDRHIGEISSYEYPHTGKKIFEVTSSGLTHSYRGNNTETNQYRIGEIVNDLNYGVMKINWTKEGPEITLELKGDDNIMYVQAIY